MLVCEFWVARHSKNKRFSVPERCLQVPAACGGVRGRQERRILKVDYTCKMLLIQHIQVRSEMTGLLVHEWVDGRTGFCLRAAFPENGEY